MAEDKDLSQKNKSDAEKKSKTKETSKDKSLDKYDQILLDTFPASDAVAKY